MTSQQRCYMERLTLKNYRCFPELSLAFHDRLNVLVAPNGGAKTAILDSIASQPSPHEPQRILAVVRNAVNMTLAPSSWRS
jgi:predicted ATP-binding protein involved in virulence